MRSWCRDVQHRLLVRLDDACERAVAERKRSLLGRLHGDVLELGPGGYPSFGYFPRDVRWRGIEPNLNHHSSILAAAARVGIPAEIVESSGCALPFRDSSFDAVVSLFALCTVPDPPVMLSEIRRVLRPGGVFAFIEHVILSRCSDPERGVAAAARLRGAREYWWSPKWSSCQLPVPSGRVHVAVVRSAVRMLDTAVIRAATFGPSLTGFLTSCPTRPIGGKSQNPHCPGFWRR